MKGVILAGGFGKRPLLLAYEELESGVLNDYQS